MLRVEGQDIALEGLRYYRSPSAFQISSELSSTEQRWAMTEVKLGLGGVLTALPVRWINHPNRNADANYNRASWSSPHAAA